MDELSDMLQSAMDSHAMESLAEDIENLRMIIKNLVHVSFFQEYNINMSRGMSPRDPRYVQIISNQKRIETRFSNCRGFIKSFKHKTARQYNR
jgi:hypothetical protein